MGPSGLVTNGCGNNCSAKHYYLPGKGVWADDNPVDKSTIGAGIGTVLGVVITHSSGDPLIISAAAVAGMFLGHEVGATFDKIDHMYLHTIFQQSLTNNGNMQSTTWKHPQKNYVINSLPVNTKGGCREFVTSVQSGNGLKQVRGNACFINNEWEVMEIY
tara:strand:+ start:152 stop:631 length:480 start_codon:yes stop_codon:yes gene_type:complete